MFSNLKTQRKQLIRYLQQTGIRDKRVLNVVESIPREHFLPAGLQDWAYANSALPIEKGQTISQPLMVALMTAALRLTGIERVLEIGTGSGYQTAILAQLVAYVYSVERYPELAWSAAEHLYRFGAQNVSIFIGDGTLGWPESAPYDRILVTAAAPFIPQPLFQQLCEGGILVVPVGNKVKQDLLVVERIEGDAVVQSLGGCVFVPLIGASGWQNDEK